MENIIGGVRATHGEASNQTELSYQHSYFSRSKRFISSCLGSLLVPPKNVISIMTSVIETKELTDNKTNQKRTCWVVNTEKLKTLMKFGGIATATLFTAPITVYELMGTVIIIETIRSYQFNGKDLLRNLEQTRFMSDFFEVYRGHKTRDIIIDDNYTIDEDCNITNEQNIYFNAYENLPELIESDENDDQDIYFDAYENLPELIESDENLDHTHKDINVENDSQSDVVIELANKGKTTRANRTGISNISLIKYGSAFSFLLQSFAGVFADKCSDRYYIGICCKKDHRLSSPCTTNKPCFCKEAQSHIFTKDEFQLNPFKFFCPKNIKCGILSDYSIEKSQARSEEHTSELPVTPISRMPSSA